MTHWQLDKLERRAIEAVRQHAQAGTLPTAACTLGLDGDEFRPLCETFNISMQGKESTDEDPPPLLPELIALLWAHRTSDSPAARLTAGAIASACFGARHLWQDIGLSGRAEVSALLERHFTRLAAENTRDLKWKRYLFLRLGERLGISDLRPPRCANCEEFPICFPPQAEAAAQIIQTYTAKNAKSSS